MNKTIRQPSLALFIRIFRYTGNRQLCQAAYGVVKKRIARCPGTRHKLHIAQSCNIHYMPHLSARPSRTTCPVQRLHVARARRYEVDEECRTRFCRQAGVQLMHVVKRVPNKHKLPVKHTTPPAEAITENKNDEAASNQPIWKRRSTRKAAREVEHESPSSIPVPLPST